MPTPGVIADSDMKPIPHQFVAHQLNIPLELLENTLQKCQAEGRISENDTGLHVVHWEVYQSEYQRQEKARHTTLNKGKYGEFENVLLTDNEYQKLKEAFPSDFGQRIENLASYMESQGKRYKSHYATILNWSRRDVGKAKVSRDLPRQYTDSPDYPDLA